MSAVESQSHAGTPVPATSAVLRAAPLIYAGTLFLSALLLFAIQPMFTKMVLPRLGGAPGVWSIAMVFFQGSLLVGYLYAHLLARLLPPGRAALVHFVALAFAGLMLPIAPAAGFAAAPTDGVEGWLIGLFAASIGLPFVVLSATAPLLQSWFAASGHVRAGNPYVLYAASNLGSFAALIAYPFGLEPLLSLQAQASLWSAGFAVLVLMVAAAAVVVANVPAIHHQADTGERAAATRPQVLAWIALAAVPAGLVVGVTAHITTDVAAAPFIWVVPLALYLVTFVAVFTDRPWIAHATAVRLVPFVLAPLTIGVLGGDKMFWLVTIVVNLVGVFLLTLVCHGELYARRPEPVRLTAFYLWTSVGGVVGGVFAGLAAPHLFTGTWEYPILIAAAVLALPGALNGGPRGILRDGAWPFVAAFAILVIGGVFHVRLPQSADIAFTIGLIAIAALIIFQRAHPARVFALVVLCFVAVEVWQPGQQPVEAARSFFGVHRVVDTADGRHRILFHGTTIHGAERLRETDGTRATGRPEPLTYYHHDGAMAQAIAAVQARGRLDRVAAVGLGTGSLACHRRDGEDWTFFEIDPEVVRIARDPKLFRFLDSCGPQMPVVLGDARLTLAASPQSYGLIVLDAFSSDAIPVHLLTREAIAGYVGRLAPGGAIAVHISNRHLDLAPALAATAAREGLVAFVKQDERSDAFLMDYKAAAMVAVLARRSEDLGDLPGRAGWRKLAADGTVAAWTDDYANILGAMWRKKTGR